MAEVSNEELHALVIEQGAELKKLKGLLETEGGIGRSLKPIKERKVTLRRIDGKVVVGYKNRGTKDSPVYIYTKPDPKDPTQRVEFVDIILDGAEQDAVVTLPYAQFRKESERVDAKVVETKEKEWEVTQGNVKKREVDGYNLIELDYDIPVDIIGKVRLYVCELASGQQITVHENYVNIA